MHINGKGVFIKLIQKKNIIYPLNELEQKGKAHLVWLTHPWSSCFAPNIPQLVSNVRYFKANYLFFLFFENHITTHAKNLKKSHFEATQVLTVNNENHANAHSFTH